MDKVIKRSNKYKQEFDSILDNMIKISKDKSNNEIKKQYVLLSQREWDYVPPDENTININEQKSRLYKSFKIQSSHSFLLTNLKLNDALVSRLVYPPFAEIRFDDKVGRVHGRTSEYFNAVVGWKRNATPILSLGFEHIYDADENIFINKEIKKIRRKLTDKVASDFMLSDTDIWKETNDKVINDMAEYFDDSQKKIRSKFNEYNSIDINGLAGTGKTIILNEVFALSDENTKLIVPNKELKKKAISFLVEVNENKVNDVLTYNELQEEMLKKTFDEILGPSFDEENDEYENYKLSIGESNINIRLPIFDIELIYRAMRTPISIDSSYVEVSRLLEQSKISHPKTRKGVVNNNIINSLYKPGVFTNFVDSKMNKLIKLMKILVPKIDEDGQEVFSVNIEELIDGIKNYYGSFMFDEAPIIIRKPLIKAMVPKIKRSIFAFDRYQYDFETVAEMEKIRKPDGIFNLSKIFRTTKQIFKESFQYFDDFPEYTALIDDSESLTANTKYKNEIKFSDVIETPEDYWGVEFKELTLILDVKPSRENANYFYLAVTRAIRRLSIIDQVDK